MTMPRPLVIALEGPCCAGKTTLGARLSAAMRGQPLLYVRDYSDFVGGGRHLPPPMPASIADEEKALARFLDLENARTARARSFTDPQGLVIIDRSVHTLLAHCHALTGLTGLDHYSSAQRLISFSSVPLWPDLVLYLDATHDVITRRNRGKFPAGSVFTDPVFNSGIARYFDPPLTAGHARVTWLDAGGDATLLCEEALTHTARSRLELSHAREER